MELRTDADTVYFHHVKAALKCAKQMAPSLVPYLICPGPACAMTAWYEMHCGRELFYGLNFLNELQEADKGDICGAHLQLGVPAT